MLGTLLESLQSWLTEVMLGLGYVGLALVLVLENLFPPIPSEVVLPLAGFLVGQGEFGFAGAVISSTLGSLAGALILYMIGRCGGRPLVLRYGRLLRVSTRDLDRAESWFARYGDAVVLGARVIPFARSVVSIPAGTLEMPLLRFTVLTTVGSALWNALLIGGGYLLGANWEQVSTWAGAYSDVILVLIAVAIVLYLTLRLPRRLRKNH